MTIHNLKMFIKRSYRWNGWRHSVKLLHET
jgi:hypothetical protein